MISGIIGLTLYPESVDDRVIVGLFPTSYDSCNKVWSPDETKG
jgi:hypothetical protein